MVHTTCLSIPRALLNIHIDKSVLMDDIHGALGVFVTLSTLSLLTVVAVGMQQVTSNMNKLIRMFNPDSRLSSAMANMAYQVMSYRKRFDGGCLHLIRP